MTRTISSLVFAALCVGHTHASASSPVGLHFIAWDGAQSCMPDQFTRPQSEEEVVSAIRGAAASGEKLKVIGAGLSFSGIQLTDGGHMISLERMTKVLSVEYIPEGGAFVEVEAGISLRELSRELETRNLALINLGATATQSIIGAASTGTHGTGTKLGAVATQIHQLRIVDGTGKVRIASATENVDIFNAARIGIGALGVVTSLTLKAVPLWKLKKTTLSYSLNQLKVDLPFLMEKYERLQWSWVPYTDSATVIIREDVPLDTPLVPSGEDGGCWSTTQSTSNCTDVSYKALTDSLTRYEQRDLYTEMEMFIDIEDSMKVVDDYIAFMDTVKDSHDPNVQLSAMLRYVAADDILLSPMNNRTSSVISMIVVGDQNVPANQDEFYMYASGLENLTETNYNSRPHWGKVNYATSSYLKTVFGSSFDEFNRVRMYMDPQGVFENEYLLQRLL